MRSRRAVGASPSEHEPGRDWSRTFGQIWQWTLRPSLLRMLGRSSPAQSAAPAPSGLVTLDGHQIEPASSDAVLVLGASGGLGKRIVKQLASDGVTVRALCRNEQPLNSFITDMTLRSRVELARADIAQPRTVLDSMLAGCAKIIDASAAKVGPSEGDDETRRKYMQGIEFYDPEVESNPENVEWKGLQSLIGRMKEQIGTREGVQLYPKLKDSEALTPLDDVVMGGVSDSAFSISSEGYGLFSGTVRTAKGGGFTSVRSSNFEPALNLKAYDGIKLRVRGDGYSYKLVLKNNYKWDTTTYATLFDTTPDEWKTVFVPFHSLVANFRAQALDDAEPFDGSSLTAIQLMLSKFKFGNEMNPNFPTNGGEFRLEIAEISTYINESTTPRIVQVSTGGATRWNRPGITSEEGISRMDITQVNEMLSVRALCPPPLGHRRSVNDT